MAYDFYYWPGIQGRGEFVRLALEYAKAPYRDVARAAGGVEKMQAVMASDAMPFAPPFLTDGDITIAHVANILQYLGPKHGLALEDEGGRLRLHQLQLTVTDFVQEIHDLHHPIANALYYEEQKNEALRRAPHFRDTRAPKYLGYFERAVQDTFTFGPSSTYFDLSLFQLVAGLTYAFPKLSARLASSYPKVWNVHARVAALKTIEDYLSSDRRIAFNDHGVFRHYPELDA